MFPQIGFIPCQTLLTCLIEILGEYRIVTVFFGQFSFFFGINVPERLIDSAIGIAVFTAVTEWAPPVLDHFHHVGMPFEQADAIRAVPGAVQNPEQFGLRHAELERTIHDDLMLQIITMTGTVGQEVTVFLDVFRTTQNQTVIGQISAEEDEG